MKLWHDTVITLSGGPRAGKTTVLEYLKKTLPNYNIVPVFCPELATLVFTNGIDYAPIGLYSDLRAAFQIEMSILQLHMESGFTEILSVMPVEPGQKKVLICDRGVLDNLAYTDDPEDRQHIVNRINYQMGHPLYLRRHYKNVVFLETSAVGGEYIKEDNSIRRENQEEAIRMGTLTYKMWTDYTEADVRFVPYHPDFEVKCQSVLQSILTFVQ